MHSTVWILKAINIKIGPVLEMQRNEKMTVVANGSHLEIIACIL